MNLTQLETVETELKRTRCSQNKVLKLTGLKRRLCGHQERLKQSYDGKDMAKTRFRGFSVKKLGFRGLSVRNQGPGT
jgi:ribosome-interacting GTPase 1